MEEIILKIKAKGDELYNQREALDDLRHKRYFQVVNSYYHLKKMEEEVESLKKEIMTEINELKETL